MPTYNTPNSIDVAIDVTVGDIEIIASDRSDTVVTVVPTNPSKEADRKGAENTKVEFDGSRLTIVGPRPRVAVFGPNESIDVKVELPTGSRLTADLSVGGLRSTGRLGATRVKGSLGAASIDATGDLWLRNSHGGIVVRAIDGTAEVCAIAQPTPGIAHGRASVAVAAMATERMATAFMIEPLEFLMESR